jgi:lipopolysaccharide transport system ATP-binding protein
VSLQEVAATTAQEPAVRIMGISKRYRIARNPATGGLYDSIGRVLHARKSQVEDDETTLWALRDITFDVAPRKVVGILGRNGSGKTTLMKILARVTSPTEGMAIVRGRVGALLQVGIGFHPELSGRDNIALSGAILGTSRQEVKDKEEQIVEFSEIGRFLDTPVKFYSSGMFMRLAFSVSAHLTSDIMLIDEVLSVGDAAFQEKCQNRIRELVIEGRTVLFVSHDTDSVRELCDSAVVLHHGEMLFQGSVDDASDYYEQEVLHLPPEYYKKKRERAQAGPGKTPAAEQPEQ